MSRIKVGDLIRAKWLPLDIRQRQKSAIGYIIKSNVAELDIKWYAEDGSIHLSYYSQMSIKDNIKNLGWIHISCQKSG